MPLALGTDAHKLVLFGVTGDSTHVSLCLRGSGYASQGSSAWPGAGRWTRPWCVEKAAPCSALLCIARSRGTEEGHTQVPNPCRGTEESHARVPRPRASCHVPIDSIPGQCAPCELGHRFLSLGFVWRRPLDSPVSECHSCWQNVPVLAEQVLATAPR